MEVEEIGYDDLSPSFADLPMEIILNIFRYLNTGDIRCASLTCRKWCVASQDSEFESKVVLKFPKIILADNSLPGTLFLNSFRPFPNIYLFETILRKVDNLFSHIGSSVEHMIFESVDITEKQLYAILKETPNLKALRLADCHSLFETGQLFESEADREALSESLRNLRSISFRMSHDLSNVILRRLTSLTPNLEVLKLHGSPFIYYISVQRNSPSLVLKNYRGLMNDTNDVINDVIKNLATTLKELNLRHTIVGNYALSLLADIKGLNLRKIEFTRCLEVNFTGLDDLFKSQKDLLDLDLSYCNLCDRCVEVICEHLTNLEVLKLRSCFKISDASITGVSKLKRLKVLDIAYCNRITSDGVQQGVAKAKNDSLLELYLCNIYLISEACLIQCAENLPNLRVFDVSYCEEGVTDKAVQAIIKNLIWLRFLSLRDCRLITDAAITGINVKAQLSNETTSCASSSIEEIDGSPRLDGPINSNKRFKISTRSKAEENIIEDAKRKKAMLAIYEMNQIDDRDQEGLSIRELKGLQTLDLRGCTKISDVSLKYGLKFLELRKLWLPSCRQITMTGIQALVENCPSIEELHLYDCYNINDKCVEVISRCLQRLQILDVSGRNQLTDHSLDYIVINCKVLKDLRIPLCQRVCSEVKLRLSTLRNVDQSHFFD